MSSPPLLSMTGISKRFGSLLANDAIDFDLRAGEIHALLGENGAGKSTLMNMLYGFFPPSEGRIEIDGIPVAFGAPADAIEHGIGMIHQEFMLVEPFTVAENLVLGTTSLPDGGARLRQARRRIREISAEYGLRVDPDARVEALAVGERQRVEILKLLFRHARILILDEPTAVLTPQETRSLFAVLDGLRQNARAIVIVTHKMQEVMEISDRVTVMRGGRKVSTVDTSATTERDLVRLMVGRDLGPVRARQPVPETAAAALVAQGLVFSLRGRPVPPLDLSVAEGEILGIAGVDGNGQSELAATLFGLRPALAGTVRLGLQEIGSRDTAARRSLGLGYVPADRRGVGALVTQSIEDNVILGDAAGFSRRGMIDRRAARATAEGIIDRFGVRTPGPGFVAGNLSGGNLQKLVLGREVSRDPVALIVEQPTRGLDVGAIELIWSEIIAQRDAGAAILLISTELDELLALADRIAVMFEGEIMGTLPRAEVSAETLGAMMAGQRSGEAAA